MAGAARLVAAKTGEAAWLKYLGTVGNVAGFIAVVSLPAYFGLDALGVGGIWIKLVGGLGLSAVVVALLLFVAVMLVASLKK